MLAKNILLKQIINNAKPVLEQMSQIVFFKGLDFIHIDANQKLVDFSKLSHINNILGREDFNLPWAESADFYRKVDEEIIADGRDRNIAMHVRIASKELVPVIQNKRPIKDPNNNIIGIMITMEESNNKILNHFLVTDIKKMPSDYTQGKYHLSNYQLYNLTPRESECLFYLLRGMQTKSIASIFGNSPRTVEKFIANLMDKFRCHCRSQLIEKAIAHGFTNFVPPSIDLKAIYS